MAAATPDYRNTLFETSTLPVHSGEPDFYIIQKWHNLLKANAMQVHTSLFGGQHGYLALLLSATAYALISPAAVVRPVHPGILVIPVHTTQHMARTMSEANKEDLRVFRECQGVEAALQQMLVLAIDPIYLEAIRDINTNAIGLPIYDIIKYLYDTYGDISPETLEEERQKTNQLTYDPALPVDIIFTKIVAFTNLAEAASSPLSQKQCIDFAYNAFRRSGAFAKFLMEWDDKPALNRTWLQFKVDFRSAVKKLKKTGGLQVSQMHANLVSEIVSGVQDSFQSIMDTSSSFSPPPDIIPSDTTEDSSVTTLQMNAISDNTVLSMQQQIQQLTQLVQQMQAATQTQPQQQNQYQGYQGYRGGRGRFPGRGGRGRSRGRGRGRGRWNNTNQIHQNQHPNPFIQNTPQQQHYPRTFNRYCWTHGACGHSSSICNAPAQGHCYEASMENRMNGNQQNCST